ncbi:MAG: hypothetical protein HYV54_01880 [Parcubacteria group bacterium]|nr:hypothetical protein [Parcubacteria group bacterium]
MDKSIFRLMGAAVAMVAIVSNMVPHSKEWLNAAIKAVRDAGPHYGTTMAYLVFHFAFAAFIIFCIAIFFVFLLVIIMVALVALSSFSIAVTYMRENNTGVARISLALLVTAISIGGVFWFILVSPSPWQSGSAALAGIGLIALICYWPSRLSQPA